MAISGPKPKSAKVTRTPTVHDWLEVPDVPYGGEPPDIGRKPRATKEWWARVSTMPHCILWADSDWGFAVDTAHIHAAFARGKTQLAGELRLREKTLGTTVEARRDLRIRYIQPVAEREEDEDQEPTNFEAERRRRLLDGPAETVENPAPTRARRRPRAREIRGETPHAD